MLMRTRFITRILLSAGAFNLSMACTVIAAAGVKSDAPLREPPGKPLIRMSLEDLSKERAEWGILYEQARQRDAAKSEATLATFFRRVIRPAAEKPAFRQSFAFAPAKFIVECFPDDVAVPILERLKRSFPGPEYAPFRSAMDLSILESYAIGKRYEAASAFLGQTNVREIAGKELEEAVFGVSSRLLQEGKPSIALTMCSNFFGSIESAVPKYCTNSIYFNHLAALESAVGNASGITHIYESMRTNHPAAYAELIYHNNGALSQAYAEQRQYLKIAALLASDLEKIAGGTFKVSESDRALMEAQALALQRKGWLDKSRKPVDIQRRELLGGRTSKAVLLAAVLLPGLGFAAWQLAKLRRGRRAMTMDNEQ